LVRPPKHPHLSHALRRIFLGFKILYIFKYFNIFNFLTDLTITTDVKLGGGWKYVKHKHIKDLHIV